MTKRVVRSRERSGLQLITAEIEIARRRVDEFDKLVVGSVSNAIVICVTRQTIRWIGKQLVDHDIAQSAASDLNRDGITLDAISHNAQRAHT